MKFWLRGEKLIDEYIIQKNRVQYKKNWEFVAKAQTFIREGLKSETSTMKEGGWWKKTRTLCAKEQKLEPKLFCKSAKVLSYVYIYIFVYNCIGGSI